MMYQVLLVYASMTGNTEAMAEAIASKLQGNEIEVTVTDIYNLDSTTFERYDGILIGSYTYGEGDIPEELLDLYDELEKYDLTGKKAALFGSGDSYYEFFCGALDHFEERLKQQGATLPLLSLKVDLWTEENDLEKCKEFGINFAYQLKQNLTTNNLLYT